MASDNNISKVLDAMLSEDTVTVNKILKSVSSLPESEQNAYSGALLMKKAGLVKAPAQKLQLFKQGRQLLEAEIRTHPDNMLYHFLRLLIQENSPPMLGYKKNIQEDAALVREQFKNFSPVIQKYVKEYSATSGILKSTDFE
ncbi:MAG: hypothetical protein JSS90_06795 [Bacteroidetes bacterium]|jgi:hypothetical protein|nr:hypothetical protein [Bacteroidota bacterium]